MRIRKEDTAVLVVDFQEKLMPAIFEGEEVLRKSAILLKGAKALGLPCVLLRQYPKGLGDIVPEIQEAVGEFVPHDKLAFSACGEESAMEAIKATGCKNILVIGVEAHICVMQSLVDLVAEGLQPVLVCDCVSSRKEYDKKIALKRAVQEGAILTTTESVLFEMLERAGSDEFKLISKLIK